MRLQTIRRRQGLQVETAAAEVVAVVVEMEEEESVEGEEPVAAE